MELSYFAIIIGAIFVNNVVFAQFLGIWRNTEIFQNRPVQELFSLLPLTRYLQKYICSSGKGGNDTRKMTCTNK